MGAFYRLSSKLAKQPITAWACQNFDIQNQKQQKRQNPRHLRHSNPHQILTRCNHRHKHTKYQRHTHKPKNHPNTSRGLMDVTPCMSKRHSAHHCKRCQPNTTNSKTMYSKAVNITDGYKRQDSKQHKPYCQPPK